MIIPGHPTFEKIENVLSKSVQELSGTISNEEVLKAAKLIAGSMSGIYRRFHIVNHIFDVAQDGNAVHQIAAFFHDVIYLQIDENVHTIAEPVLSNLIDLKSNPVKTRTGIAADPWVSLCLTIFGFSEGQNLNPYGGQNEFLSCLVAAKILENKVTLQKFLPIAICIEATVPFRPSPFEKLKERIVKANQDLKLDLNEKDIENILITSVEFANKDVANFSESNIATFLSNTWQIIPETNHQLRFPEKYTLKEFQTALLKMEQFLNFLNPNNVFHSYLDHPASSQLQALCSYAKKNIEVAKLFIGNKLVSLALLEAIVPNDNEALSNISGVHEDDEFNKDILDYLPKIFINYDQGISLNPNVVNMFDLDFDTHVSKLSRFIYLSNGHETTLNLLVDARLFFEKKIEKDVFLAKFNPYLVAAVSHALLNVGPESMEAHFRNLRNQFVQKISNTMTQYDFNSFLKKAENH